MEETEHKDFKSVGVIGSGRFGITVAKLLAIKNDVYLFTRRPEVCEEINTKRKYRGIDFEDNITATSDIELICRECQVLFPIVPSTHFRDMIRMFSDHLKPHHILIHGTKGFDLPKEIMDVDTPVNRSSASTMSQVIVQESAVLRVGCISGPNLATEILGGQPAATVIASEFQEVIRQGEDLLSSNRFFVFGSYDLKGAEIAGAFKNIIALGAGMLAGKGYGKNMQSLIITRGLREMIQFGEFLGASSTSFLGTAGIGDLIATATSESSRNHTFGKRLGLGESTEEILASMDEVVEGVRTLNTVFRICREEKLVLPIVFTLYKIVFEEFDLDRAISILMNNNYIADVDFM